MSSGCKQSSITQPFCHHSLWLLSIWSFGSLISIPSVWLWPLPHWSDSSCWKQSFARLASNASSGIAWDGETHTDHGLGCPQVSMQVRLWTSVNPDGSCKKTIFFKNCQKMCFDSFLWLLCGHPVPPGTHDTWHLGHLGLTPQQVRGQVGVWTPQDDLCHCLNMAMRCIILCYKYTVCRRHRSYACLIY